MDVVTQESGRNQYFSRKSEFLLTDSQIRTFALCISALLMSFIVLLCPASAKDIVVRDPTQLADAITTAENGDVIKLAVNIPFEMVIKNRHFSPPLTVESLVSALPAEIPMLKIVESSGIIISNIHVIASKQTRDGKSQTIEIIRSADITLSQCSIKGTATEYLTKSNQSKATGEDLMLVRWSKNIQIRNSTFSNFCQGIAILESTDLQIDRNDLSLFQGDGLRMGGVQRVQISNNHIHDFLGSDQTVNHSDMIQLWSTNTTLVSSDIDIEKNWLLSGDGPATQSIFMRNEQADQAVAAVGRYYSRITVKDNVIYNGHLHGITVGETNHLVIANNTLIENPASSMGTGSDRSTWAPAINVAKLSTDVKITANVVGGIFAPINDPGRENYLLSRQSQTRLNELKSFYFGSLFVGKVPESAFKARPGTVVSRKKLGSSMSF